MLACGRSQDLYMLGDVIEGHIKWLDSRVYVHIIAYRGLGVVYGKPCEVISVHVHTPSFIECMPFIRALTQHSAQQQL
jgi:hypothetical protein